MHDAGIAHSYLVRLSIPLLGGLLEVLGGAANGGLFRMLAVL
jgi:hypothetical protein